MPPRKQPWFRFYVEALWDPKIRDLSVETRWLWVAVLGLARSSPIPGFLLLTERQEFTEQRIADAAALPVAKVKRGLQQLSQLMLIERDNNIDAWCVVRWNERQFESDETSLRTAKHRSKGRSNDVPGNGDVTHQIQRQITETETETEKKIQNSRTSENREENANPRPSAAQLIDRMSVVCENGGARMAGRVVDVLLDHVDPMLVDECIGFTTTLDRNKRPRDPRYFLTAVRDFAEKRGVQVPVLELPPEPPRVGLGV